MMMNDMTMTRK